MEMLNILNITSNYAGFFGLLYLFLSLNVIRYRWKYRVGIGGGNKTLDRAIRIHANFSEYAPLGLLLIALSELSGASDNYLHIAVASLLIGRISHAVGLSINAGVSIYRTAGMILTFTSIALTSGFLISNIS